MNSTEEKRLCNFRSMDLGGAISKLLSQGAELLPAVITSAHSPSTSSASPAVDQNQKIEAELKKLMRLLERIKATLYVAEQREITDSSVKLWLKELKGVVYSAEDVLDEYHYEVLRAHVESRDASPPDSRKRKLIQVPYGMLDRIKQIRSRFDEIANERIALQLMWKEIRPRRNNELQRAPTSPLVVESNIFGRESEKEKLIDVLSFERDVVSVVAVVGLVGIGKTTVAQLAYNDQRIRQRFDIFGWICVSEDFNVERLTKQFLESITGNLCSLTHLSALHEKIWEAISGKRVLLVLDDVSNVNKSFWNSFKAPFMSATFAKILVTTRNDHVMRIMQTEQPIHLGPLPPKECWQLFEHYAFDGVEHNKDQRLVAIGKEIVKKGGMLPLVLKSIASLLRHEVEEESWRQVLESEILDIFSSIEISDAWLPTTETMCTVSPNKNVKRRINSWNRGKQLGGGSFGTVYEAISDEGFFFAVKEVLIHEGNHAQRSIAQLEQEINLLSQFEHENIVQYYGTHMDETKLNIFLELMTQGSIQSLYQKYPLHDTLVSEYTRQILYGLVYLHERNIVHRDIKCANILVHANGSVKIADFGLAKKITTINILNSCKGTVYWMAPEVINPKKARKAYGLEAYGLEADIWSLGCTVLEMLTRKIPYPNMEWPEAFFKIGMGEQPAIPNYLSIQAQDFITQCIRVNPNERPSAVQLLEDPFVKIPPASQS